MALGELLAKNNFNTNSSSDIAQATQVNTVHTPCPEKNAPPP